jgi:pyruvate dehydrogenase E2 component (dihydrolipoamide acetyltransferase)
MPTEFLVPELGESVKGGDVLRVLVKPGDTLTKDQPVLELETDKATIEVPSSVEGTIVAVHVKPGDKVKVGQSVLAVDAGAAAPSPAPAQAQAAAETSRADDAPPAPVKPSRSAAPAAAAPKPAAAAQGGSAAGAVEFKIPTLGENVKGGDVLRVLVAVGDTVAEDQPLVELETDKATIEVPSTVAGQVASIAVKQGDTVTVGQTVMTISGSGAKADAAPAAKADAPAPATTVSDFPAARPAEARGRSGPAEVVDISRGARQAPAAAAAESPVRDTRAPAPAAPSVRRLARELGLDIHEVPGSGPGGRISAADVTAHAKRLVTSRPGGESAASGAAVAEPALPDFSAWGEIDPQPLRGIRRKTAEHLSQAWRLIPHVTQGEKADITELEALRGRFAKLTESSGGKLTVTVVALKIVAAALKKFPQFNASIDVARETVVYKKYVHVGVAVDTDRGLLVPVVRDVDTKGILQLAGELQQLAEKARAGKLSLADMQGGCFTISNLGGIGGTHFSPIVNHPEVAILGMSRGRMEPVWKDGQFVPRLMLPLSLSYDHRLIDGADAIRFVRFIVDALEQPFLLVLQ